MIYIVTLGPVYNFAKSDKIMNVHIDLFILETLFMAFYFENKAHWLIQERTPPMTVCFEC